MRRKGYCVMERRQLPPSESRLIVLKALELLGPVTATELTEFLAGMDQLNYFEIMLCLIQMQESGEIETLTHPIETLYRLTEKGSYATSAFARQIPPSVLHLMTASVRDFQPRFLKEQQAPASLVHGSNGQSCIRLRLLENHLTLLDLKMMLPHGIQLPYLQQRWSACASAIYQMLTRTLSDNRGCADGEDLSEHAGLVPLQKGEWLLFLQDSDPSPSFSVSVTLADEALALHWARRWETAWPELKQEILSLLLSWTRD